MSEKIKKILHNLQQKPMLLGGIGCLLLFCSCFFMIYFIRVVYSPSWVNQFSASVVLFLITFLVALFVVLSKKWAKENTALFMTSLIFICGVFFSLVTPPNQVPDEPSHFLRSYAMAMGDFHYDQNQKWPNDVNLLMENFPAAYRNGYPSEKGNSILTCYKNYNNALQQGKTGANQSIIIFQTIPYLPQAFGIFLARIFGANALICYWLARIANVAFYSFCCYFALKWAFRFRIILFSIMIMPLTIFIAASCSNDASLLAGMFLVIASVLADKFDLKKAVTFTVAISVLCTSKLNFIVFLPLVFAVSKDSWQIKIKKWQYALITFAAFILLYQLTSISVAFLSNYTEIPRTMSDTNPAEQLRFILSNPLRYIVVFLDTLKNNSFFLFSGGLFGWIDVDIRIISYFTPIILLINTFKNSHRIEKRDFSKVMWFLVVSILTYGVVLTGMYLSWTPVTLPQVIGLQMRYMLPAFTGILLFVGYWFSGYMKKQQDSCKGFNSAIYTSFLFCMVACGLLFIAYYFPTKVIVYVS